MEEQIKDGICKGKPLCRVMVAGDCAFCEVCGWFDDPVLTPTDPYEGNQLITTKTTDNG